MAAVAGAVSKAFRIASIGARVARVARVARPLSPAAKRPLPRCAAHRGPGSGAAENAGLHAQGRERSHAKPRPSSSGQAQSPDVG